MPWRCPSEGVKYQILAGGKFRKDSLTQYSAAALAFIVKADSVVRVENYRHSWRHWEPLIVKETRTSSMREHY